MSTTRVWPPRKRKSGDIVKSLGNICSISLEFLANPKSEDAFEIFWQITCHLVGEASMLQTSLENKRLKLLKEIHHIYLMNGVPSEKAPTLHDFIRPSSERLVLLFSFIIPFIEQFDANLYKRELLTKEHQKIRQEEKELNEKIAKTCEATNALVKRAADVIKMRDAHHEESLHLEKLAEDTGEEASRLSATQATAKEAFSNLDQRRINLKSQTERTISQIQFIEENLNRAERQQDLLREIQEAKENLVKKAEEEQERLNHKKNLETSFQIVERTVKHCNKNQEAQLHEEEQARLKPAELELLSEKKTVKLEIKDITKQENRAEKKYQKRLRELTERYLQLANSKTEFLQKVKS